MYVNSDSNVEHCSLRIVKTCHEKSKKMVNDLLIQLQLLI
jgi:hypothetical protein